MPPDKKEKFHCPECGSNQSAVKMYVSTNYSPNGPWSAVLQRITCGQCDSEISAHLAELWDGRSIEEAKKEWIEKYKVFD